jgi:hypothetical protein
VQLIANYANRRVRLIARSGSVLRVRADTLPDIGTQVKFSDFKEVRLRSGWIRESKVPPYKTALNATTLNATTSLYVR